MEQTSILTSATVASESPPAEADSGHTICHVRIEIVAPPLNRVLVITEPVPAGDPVIAEAPVYVLRSCPKEADTNYTALYEELTEAQRKFIEGLEPSEDGFNFGLSPKADLFRRALRNNSHSWRGGGNTQSRAVFSHISFAEHSCRPNTFFVASSNANRGLLIAMKNLNPGDRVTISYIHAHAPLHGIGPQCWPRWMRRQSLLTLRGFECKCDFCENDDPRPGSALSVSLGRACQELGAFLDSGELFSDDFNGELAKSERMRFLVLVTAVEDWLERLSKQIQTGAENSGIGMADVVFYRMHLCKIMFDFHMTCFTRAIDEADHFVLVLQYFERWCSNFSSEMHESGFATHECLAEIFEAAWGIKAGGRPRPKIGLDNALEVVQDLWQSFGKIKCYLAPHLGVKPMRKNIYMDYSEVFGSHSNELPSMEKVLQKLRAALSRLSNASEGAEQTPPTKRFKQADVAQSLSDSM